MAVHHATVTLTGAAQVLSATSTNVQFLIIENPTSNADVKVGGSTLTSTDYGVIVEDGPASRLTITGTQANPVNLNSTYVLGSTNEKIHILWTA